MPRPSLDSQLHSPAPMAAARSSVSRRPTDRSSLPRHSDPHLLPARSNPYPIINAAAGWGAGRNRRASKENQGTETGLVAFESRGPCEQREHSAHRGDSLELGTAVLVRAKSRAVSALVVLRIQSFSHQLNGHLWMLTNSSEVSGMLRVSEQMMGILMASCTGKRASVRVLALRCSCL